ncbi:MAG: rhodanese-like domain-containing protein [Marinilabiliaceae bacterium]|nr:rhodanese-like domain-containing protein [Marinilabiliaceae bacterium]
MNKYYVIAALLVAAGAFFAFKCAQKPQTDGKTKVEVITPAAFKERLATDSTAFLLDVRRPEEYAEGHLEGATLMNWSDQERFKEEAKKLDKSKTIYIYCRSGRRSNAAAQYLAGEGYTTVDMQGGILAWRQAGL